MTLIQVLRSAAAVAAWGAVLIGATAWFPSAERDGAMPAATSVRHPATSLDSTADSAIRALGWAAPFRLDRRSPEVGYDPRLVAQPAPPPADAPTSPVLTLVGLVLDTAPRALISGVPGVNGAVLLGVGDSAGGIRVRRIRRDQVLVSGHDTSWTLTLRSDE